MHIPTQFSSGFCRHAGQVLCLLAVVSLLVGLGTAKAQNPVSTVEDNQGNQLMRLFDNGNLELFQNGALTVPGDIESTGGVIILQDGTTLSGSGDLGLSLPFSGSVGSSSPAFELENTGSGSALTTTGGGIVASSGDIEAASGDFVLQDGTRLSGSGDLGQLSLPFSGSGSVGGTNSGLFEVDNTGSGDGIRVLNAGDDGFEVENAGGAGYQARNATNHGVFIGEVGSPSTVPSQPDPKSAFEVQASDQNGLSVGRADRDGVLVEQAGESGFQVDDANFNGLYVGSADQEGIFVSSAGTEGIEVTADGDGIRASGDADEDGTGIAGNFNGDVDVSGTLSKGGGSFKIDHPQDPTGKYLQHGFVESPQMTNIYKGNVTLDASGAATVQLPDYLESINRDFQYQLTAIGAAAPRLHVAEEVSNNTFRIAGGEPNMKVSWQITAVRDDAYARQNRIQVVKEKPQAKRGTYRHPEAHGAPKSAGEKAQERRENPEEMERRQNQ